MTWQSRISIEFLVAYTRLYKSLCRSVSRSVGRSVCRSDGPSVTLLKFLPKGYLNCIKAPAHLYATDAVVYTALFYLFLWPYAHLLLLPFFQWRRHVCRFDCSPVSKALWANTNLPQPLSNISKSSYKIHAVQCTDARQRKSTNFSSFPWPTHLRTLLRYPLPPLTKTTMSNVGMSSHRHNQSSFF